MDTLSKVKNGIDSFLTEWIKENENCYPCQNIYTNYKLYGSQLFAYEFEGDTIVLMNYIFQHPEEKRDISRPYFMTDGWYHYWQVRYSLKKKKYYNLEINGKA